MINDEYARSDSLAFIVLNIIIWLLSPLDIQKMLLYVFKNTAQMKCSSSQTLWERYWQNHDVQIVISISKGLGHLRVTDVHSFHTDCYISKCHSRQLLQAHSHFLRSCDKPVSHHLCNPQQWTVLCENGRIDIMPSFANERRDKYESPLSEFKTPSSLWQPEWLIL